jgi:ribosomal protein S18 acetylase RimI-like enzyme
MSNGEIDRSISELREFCIKSGVPEEALLCADNLEKYVETAIDAYRNYPMFMYVFNGNYDEKTLARMFRVDFKSRRRKMLGISNGDYESMVLVEPPKTKRTRLMQYLRAADLPSYSLMLNPATYRQDAFEKYALKMRKPYLDEKTWYVYIFATKKVFQRMGYGKQLMNVLVSFANEKGYRLCLETNATENVTMYQRFGFKLMDTSNYKQRMAHYVMLYTGK